MISIRPQDETEIPFDIKNITVVIAKICDLKIAIVILLRVGGSVATPQSPVTASRK